MNVFVFEFEESFDLACLPQNMEIKCPFDVIVKFFHEFLTFKFISPTKWQLNADFCSFIKPVNTHSLYTPRELALRNHKYKAVGLCNFITPKMIARSKTFSQTF